MVIKCPSIGSERPSLSHLRPRPPIDSPELDARTGLPPNSLLIFISFFHYFHHPFKSRPSSLCLLISCCRAPTLSQFTPRVDTTNPQLNSRGSRLYCRYRSRSNIQQNHNYYNPQSQAQPRPSHIPPFTMSTIKEITTEDEWRSHVASLSSSTLLIISFHAPWAAPCAQMATVLKTLAAEYPANGETSWVSLNAEELSDISETYDVTAVPYLVLQRNDQVLETVSGSSAVKVRTAIEKHAKGSGDSTTTTAASTNGASAAIPTEKTAEEEGEEIETDPAKAKEELFKRLGELVKAAPVMLFMKGTPSAPQCGFSRQVVALLRERSVKYGFFNILADDEVRQGLKEFAEWPTYPQLWVDGDLVGGLDIIKEEIDNDPEFLKAHVVAKDGVAAA
ncbi:thioredoxin-like protein [Xylaria arbuscula]|nr:thioredoxin-like protein [Xylaria arbuscula]